MKVDAKTDQLWISCLQGIFYRNLACPAGIEPATPSLEGSCSIQLSYGQVVRNFYTDTRKKQKPQCTAYRHTIQD